MTPKFKYDPEQHCLREVARVREPVRYMFHLARTYQLARQSYEQHLASLRVIPCAPGSKWPEGELDEGVHFRQTTFLPSFNIYAEPITPQPRLYTQEEALEIWDGGWNAAIYYSIHDEENITKQKYFKTRFNVEL